MRITSADDPCVINAPPSHRIPNAKRSDISGGYDCTECGRANRSYGNHADSWNSVGTYSCLRYPKRCKKVMVGKVINSKMTLCKTVTMCFFLKVPFLFCHCRCLAIALPLHTGITSIKARIYPIVVPSMRRFSFPTAHLNYWAPQILLAVNHVTITLAVTLFARGLHWVFHDISQRIISGQTQLWK